MSEPSLDEVAERFDAVYTRLTGLQRRLIAATRDGLDDRAARKLVREASAAIAAFEAADWTPEATAAPVVEVHAEALRARVLAEPVDGVLVMAAARAQTRRYAYPLLAEALSMDEAEDAWSGWTVMDVLIAPHSIGETTGRALAKHGRP